jgi:hypothetical protein
MVNGDGLGQIHRENEQRHVRGDNCGVREEKRKGGQAEHMGKKIWVRDNGGNRWEVEPLGS